MRNTNFFPVFIVFALLAFGACEKQPEEVFCTQEAMLCPDGSYVGRTGPNCEFAPCPEPTENDDWLTSTDSETATRFEYPAELETTYITAFNWPPQIQVSSTSFTCESPVLVNGMEYCVSSTTEGAAGSVYTEYAYSFPKEDQTVTLTFTLQSVQCGNYDETEKLACEAERDDFDVSKLVDEIAQTLIFIGS